MADCHLPTSEHLSLTFRNWKNIGNNLAPLLQRVSLCLCSSDKTGQRRYAWYPRLAPFGCLFFSGENVNFSASVRRRLCLNTVCLISFTSGHHSEVGVFVRITHQVLFRDLRSTFSNRASSKEFLPSCTCRSRATFNWNWHQGSAIKFCEITTMTFLLA